MITELTIRKADDMHLHLRQGAMLKAVLPATVMQCGRAIIMPNTLPPITTPSQLISYRQEIEAAIPEGKLFVPLMTAKLTKAITPQSIIDLKQVGMIAGKFYPEGVTTHSEDGVRNIVEIYPVLEAMQAENVVLCLHGEAPGVFSLDREDAFLHTLKQLVKDFPRLRIVLEHVTTASAVTLVKELPDTVGATITAHHLYLTLDDVIGDKLQPHHFCKPIAKRPEDRDALVAVALEGNRKFFLGSDSAPHTVDAKECACGAAGVYTASVLLPVLAELFESHDALPKLEGFTSQFGADFYKLPYNQEMVRLVKSSWEVPVTSDGVVPFRSGEKLAWKVDSHV